jgi:hypothetical protein
MRQTHRTLVISRYDFHDLQCLIAEYERQGWRCIGRARNRQDDSWFCTLTRDLSSEVETNDVR